VEEATMIIRRRTRQRRQFRYPYRRRPPGLLWVLLGLLGLGALAGLLVNVRLGARRRSRTAREDAPFPEPEEEDHEALGDRETYAETAPPESLSVWISGPQGNLFVRDGGAGHGVPILLLHSLAGNGGQWALQLDHLRRHRRAVAVDLRGHGDSDPADDGDYSIPAFAADVAAAADQLDLRHFVLAGHSLGAAVAIEYASRHPERVVGLLLVDPNGDQTRVPREQMEPFLEALREDPLGELDSYFRQLLLQGDRDASRWVLEDIRLTHEDAVAKAVQGSIEYAPLPALERYEGPKLSILSDMNNLPYSLHRLVPDLPVRFMPDTGHWLMMDRPEVFNGLLDEFLGSDDGTA
jgi:pimeloyl-ACP methyl ester carboxylesterase